jgi:hypothetical protein
MFKLNLVDINRVLYSFLLTKVGYSTFFPLLFFMLSFID